MATSWPDASKPSTSYPSAALADASTNGVGDELVLEPIALLGARPEVSAAIRALRPISSATTAAASATPRSSMVSEPNARIDSRRARRDSSSSLRPPSPRPGKPRPKPGRRSSNRSAPNLEMPASALSSCCGIRRRPAEKSVAQYIIASAPRSAAFRSSSWRSSHGTSSSRSSP
eukprot:scaffold243393_cov31-Tisochrysis_lutea.AAC.2